MEEKKSKDWVGNSKSIYTTLGCSNHVEAEREANDFYASSVEAAEWLLKLEPQIDNIWENAVGQGHLAETFRKAGKLKAISDLVDRGYHPEGIVSSYGKDFLKINKTKGNFDIVTNPPYACYDKNTEVYTKEGWKYFHELQGNEEILSVNPNNLELEWSPIVAQHEYEIDDELIHFKNRLQDILVTKNHRMFVFSNSWLLKHKELKLQVDELGDVYTASKVNRSSVTPKWGYVWKGIDQDYFILPECEVGGGFNAKKVVPSVKIKMNDWLRFFGLWLADGSCNHTKNSQGNQRYGVMIGQDVKTFSETKNIFDSLPFKYTVKHTEGTRIYNFVIESKQLWSYLIQFGYSRDKYIPSFIKELPVDRLKIFLNSYLFGDSTKFQIGEQKHKMKTDGCKISSVSKKLIEDFHEIVLKLGYLVSSIATYSEKMCLLYNFNYFYERKKQQNYIMYKQKEVINYKGKVYCVTLEKNGFMLIRRNDKICFCGNSALPFVKKSLELVQEGHYVAMFLKLTFLEGKERKQFFQESPPMRVWVSSSRIPCAKNGEFLIPKKDKIGNAKLDKEGNLIMEKVSSAVAYAWYVWQKGYKGDTIIKWFN